MRLVAQSFFDQILLELLAAVGGALFLGNLLALVRRRQGARSGDPGDLRQAPVGRTVLYLVIGLVVMTWGIGSLIAG